MEINNLNDGRFEIIGYGIVWDYELVKTLKEIDKDI